MEVVHAARWYSFGRPGTGSRDGDELVTAQVRPQAVQELLVASVAVTCGRRSGSDAPLTMPYYRPISPDLPARRHRTGPRPAHLGDHQPDPAARQVTGAQSRRKYCTALAACLDAETGSRFSALVRQGRGTSSAVSPTPTALLTRDSLGEGYRVMPHGMAPAQWRRRGQAERAVSRTVSSGSHGPILQVPHMP